MTKGEKHGMLLEQISIESLQVPYKLTNICTTELFSSFNFFGYQIILQISNVKLSIKKKRVI